MFITWLFLGLDLINRANDSKYTIDFYSEYWNRFVFETTKTILEKQGFMNILENLNSAT